MKKWYEQKTKKQKKNINKTKEKLMRNKMKNYKY